LLLTSYSDDEVRHEADRSGADGCLSKFAELRELTHALAPLAHARGSRAGTKLEGGTPRPELRTPSRGQSGVDADHAAGGTGDGRYPDGSMDALVGDDEDTPSGDEFEGQLAAEESDVQDMPGRPPSAGAGRRSEEASIKRYPERSFRVLVVDDDEVFGDSVMEFFGQVNVFSLKRARDGKEALEAVSEFRPHAVILDLVLPRVSGLQVCRKIRNWKHSKFTPVVMVTGHATDENVKRAIQVGADACLSKPVDLDELRHEIWQCARRAALAARAAPNTR